MPWYRPFDVVKTSSGTHGGKNRAACRTGKWPPRGDWMTVLTYSCRVAFSSTKGCARVTGKADKAVGSQMW